MSQYRIGILNGDDIGLEVVPVAVEVLKAAVKKYPEVNIEWVELPIGYPSYLENGETLPQKTLDTLHSLDGWVLGPIGHMAYPKDDPKAVNPHPILRRQFDLMSNIRPSKSHPSVPCLHRTRSTRSVVARRPATGTPALSLPTKMVGTRTSRWLEVLRRPPSASAGTCIARTKHTPRICGKCRSPP